MAASTSLTVELDDTEFVGEQTISGRIVLPDDVSPADVAEVQLRGRFRSMVKGGDDLTEVVFEETVSPQAAGDELVFEVPAPAGPYSFDDNKASVEWELEATAVSEDGTELATTSTDFELSSGDVRERSGDTALEQAGGLPDTMLGNILESITSAFGQPTSLEEIHRSIRNVETGTGPYEREHSLWGNLPLILILVGFGLAGIIFAPRIVGDMHVAVPWVIRGVGLILVGIGGWVFYTSIRNRMAKSAVGEVDFWIEPDDLVRGDTFTCTVAFSPESEIEINHVNAELKCVKTDKTKGRRPSDPFHHHHDPHDSFDDDDEDTLRTRTYTDTLFSEPIELAGSDQIDIGEKRGFTEKFTIPENSPHSYIHTTPFFTRMIPARGLLLSRKIEWFVELHIDIDGWPDWKTQYQCRVYP